MYSTAVIRKNLLLSLAVVGALCVPTFVSAETVLRTGGDVTVSSNQTVEGNYYVSSLSGKTTMSGAVNRDMLAAGGSVTVNGTVGEDLHILAGLAQVYGAVEGDVRVLGGEVTIGDRVGGDVFVIGGVLNVLPTAEIGGDIFFFGGTARVEGAVGGFLYGRAEQVVVNASIGQSVDMRTVNLQLGERAEVVGDVRYTSQFELVRDSRASVGGTVVHNAQQPTDPRAEARALLVPLLVLLFTTLALYLVFKRELEVVTETILHTAALSALIGMGVFLLGPILSITMMLTVLGSVVGLIGLLVFVVLLLVSVAAIPVFVGALVFRLFGRSYEVSLLSILAGSAVCYTLLFIPVIGGAMLMAAMFFTLGGIVMTIYRLMI